MKFNVACVQVNSQNDMDHNISNAKSYIKKAAADGAQLITLPENAFFMSANGAELLQNTYLIEEHPAIVKMQKLAAELDVWILVGSSAIKVTHSEKIANRSIMIDSSGQIAATYDKIHLYNASIDGGETHRESDRFIAGDKIKIAETPWGKVGMTICYDLRFPHLYRKMAKSGAHIMTVPAAFTKFTGEAHWHTLLRARAIENASFIIAPAQTGSHPANRKTFGHSMIIDPWGKVLEDAGENEGYIIAQIDTSMAETVRKQLPSLEHDREFDL